MGNGGCKYGKEWRWQGEDLRGYGFFVGDGEGFYEG